RAQDTIETRTSKPRSVRTMPAPSVPCARPISSTQEFRFPTIFSSEITERGNYFVTGNARILRGSDARLLSFPEEHDVEVGDAAEIGLHDAIRIGAARTTCLAHPLCLVVAERFRVGNRGGIFPEDLVELFVKTPQALGCANGQLVRLEVIFAAPIGFDAGRRRGWRNWRVDRNGGVHCNGRNFWRRRRRSGCGPGGRRDRGRRRWHYGSRRA